MAEGSPMPVSAWQAGLQGRCPACGRGRLFSGYLQVAEHCEACGLDLARQDSGDGPAVFVIFIIGALVVPMALLLEAWGEPAAWVHVVVWPPVILAGAVALLRPLKGLMIALQFRHDAGERD